MADTRYALGVEIAAGNEPINEVALIEKMSERMYRDAAELRNCENHWAASALESAAYEMVGQADRYRDMLRGGRPIT